MRFFEIHEARKNKDHPAQAKISVNEQLLKYAKDGYYVSFTMLPKIGINPKSRYNTPLGIYCYPIKYYKDSLKNKEISTAFPFAADNKFINIIKEKKPLKDVSEYSDADLSRDIPKLQKMFGFTDEQITQYIFQSNFRKTPIGKFWGICFFGTTDYAQKNNKKASLVWANALRKLGYSGFTDNTGMGIIHPNEPIQAFFLTSSDFEVIEQITKYAQEPNSVYYNKMKVLDPITKKYLAKMHSNLGKDYDNVIVAVSRLLSHDSNFVLPKEVIEYLLTNTFRTLKVLSSTNFRKYQDLITEKLLQEEYSEYSDLYNFFGVISSENFIKLMEHDERYAYKARYVKSILEKDFILRDPDFVYHTLLKSMEPYAALDTIREKVDVIPPAALKFHPNTVLSVYGKDTPFDIAYDIIVKQGNVPFLSRYRRYSDKLSGEEIEKFTLDYLDVFFDNYNEFKNQAYLILDYLPIWGFNDTLLQKVYEKIKSRNKEYDDDYMNDLLDQITVLIEDRNV